MVVEWGPPSHLQQPWNLLSVSQPTFKDLLKRILLRNGPWWSSPCDQFFKQRTTATNAIAENDEEPDLVEQCQFNTANGPMSMLGLLQTAAKPNLPEHQ